MKVNVSSVPKLLLNTEYTWIGCGYADFGHYLSRSSADNISFSILIAQIKSV